MASHSDEMKQLFHVIQVVTGTELSKANRKVIDTWMWGFVDRTCEDYESQLKELLRLDMPRRRGWVRYERFEPSEKQI